MINEYNITKELGLRSELRFILIYVCTLVYYNINVLYMQLIYLVVNYI